MRPLRAATIAHVDALLALARTGGTGLTNLPPDRRALLKRLSASEAALTDPAARDRGAGIIFVVDDPAGGVSATSAVFPCVGAEWPFYSYRMVRQARDSKIAERRTEQTLLMLSNDFDGEAEVGGLFVAPAARSLSLGGLAARSRYLFIAQHRSWFGKRVIAELRGWQDAEGRSPVWEAIGRNFYDMTLAEADQFGSVRGNQFIADLGPRHPIYTSLLSSEARQSLGRPHDDGGGALAMLLKEGFQDQGYVDIFDGGPTPVAAIDELSTVRQSRVAKFAGTCREATQGREATRAALVAVGQGVAFRVLQTMIEVQDHDILLPENASRALSLDVGEEVRWCPSESRLKK